MSKLANDRPFVLSIAGFDPSGGAGVLADIKTMEQLHVYGLGVITANTFQTHNEFEAIDWIPEEAILRQAELMLQTYPIKAIKIGLLPDFGLLRPIKALANKYGNPTIVLDPIAKSSTGYGFHKKLSSELLQCLDLITPNWNEIQLLGEGNDTNEIANNWSQHSTVLLKGGHSKEDQATDYLIQNRNSWALHAKRLENVEKHGSGCMLSSAITAHLALGIEMKEACAFAKDYTLKRLCSNDGLLAYHKL